MNSTPATVRALVGELHPRNLLRRTISRMWRPLLCAVGVVGVLGLGFDCIVLSAFHPSALLVFAGSVCATGAFLAAAE